MTQHCRICGKPTMHYYCRQCIPEGERWTPEEESRLRGYRRDRELQQERERNSLSHLQDLMPPELRAWARHHRG